MIDMLQWWAQSTKIKRTASGWYSGNAPCCHHNGESPDKRQRGGLKPGVNSWAYHCFNCGFTASFTLGRHLSFKARRLLSWLNVPQEEIERINLESLKHRSIEGILDSRQEVWAKLQQIEFEDRDLPKDAEPIEPNTPEYEYLVKRCAPLDYPYLRRTKQIGLVNKKILRPGIIVPFTYGGQIVGYSQRFLDDARPKYLNDFQHGYVFGTDLQQAQWKYAIVVEGLFDALSISGLAVMHNSINDEQVKLIRSLDKEVIVVPDQDYAGLELVDQAIKLGWAVSIPAWPDDVKDVNDAVRKFGKLSTLLSIMQSKQTSRIKIELRKKALVRSKKL